MSGSCCLIGPACLDGTRGRFGPVSCQHCVAYGIQLVLLRCTGCTLGCVTEAGVSEENVLSLEHPLPSVQDELCLIATDDTLLFHRSQSKAAKTLRARDRTFEKRGIPRNKA